jgi:DNA (cytosine-5)-methyltransferase 1
MLVVLRRNADASIDHQLPLPVIAAGGQHLGLAEPIIINGRRNNIAKPVSLEPVPTLDTKGGVWLAEPFVVSTRQNTGGPAPRSVQEPLPTATATDSRLALAAPFILNRHGENGAVRAHSIDEPVPTADCRGAGYLAQPFVLSQASGGAPRSTEEPLPAAPTGGAHALLVPYYGSGSGETCATTDEPIPTITSKARFGMIVPITHSDGSNRARDTETDPLPTLTTAKRGELAFITAQFGEREGQAPRVHSIAEPAPAICASGHVNLVEPADEMDCLYRMLVPHELAAAMGFNQDEVRYEFAGNKTEQIKQIGNAVSVEMMEAEVLALMAGAVPKKKATPAREQQRASA